MTDQEVLTAPDSAPAELVAKAVALSWDWREQPDLAELAHTVQDVSGGTVYLYEVRTDSDNYAIVIANVELDEAAARAAYEREDSDG